ncbi:beta-galactosidase [Dactylosporangium siamense]|uniref:beta-galactosidase n=1 Tax=Dactylosporangium siamense TaxID=685454 RepID=A0A919PTW8_9ACTN|nr:beta-galactosidase [Dactylosporangium siamense]GIG50137.1 hypothetical protein Dsi01nite_081780 [Dactylosporangium siamense]
MTKPTFGFFPVGAVHHADYLKQSPPLDPDDYREFMRGEITAMQRLGLTSYDMNFAWFDLEVAPGEFDWRRTDAVYEICAELGLPIFAWIFAELTPRWLVQQHPETAAVAATGYSGPSHSYGSALVRRRMREYITAVVERYDDPQRILAYNVGVESGLFWIEEQDSSEPAARLWDYNPEVVAGFGPWLRQRYGTLAELNRVYRDHYRDFAEVQPPNSRFIQEQFMLINQVPWLDWRTYMCDVLTGYIHFKAGCVRDLRPDAVVAEQSYVIDPAVNGQDIWRTNAAMDAVGTSMFVSNTPGEHLQGSYWHDYFRSSGKGKPYWIWELRCGPNAWGLTSWGLPISAADTARLTWQAIGHEVKSVQYWNWRPHIGGIEVGGHAMTTRNGELTPRAERIGRIARTVNADADWYASLRFDPAGIAMLDPKLARIVATGEGSDRYVTEAQFGMYAAVRGLGHRVDFLHDDEVAAGGLDAYKVLLIPFGYAMDSRTAATVTAWVRNGGTLAAGMWCGAKDEHGYGQPFNPGLGLHEVFGAHEVELQPVLSPQESSGTDMSFSFGRMPSGEPVITLVAGVSDGGSAAAGQTFEGLAYLSRLAVQDGAQVVAVDETGAPVVVHHRFGAGRALLVGTVPARPVDQQFRVDGLSRLLDDLARDAGVVPPARLVEPTGRMVEVELLRGTSDRDLVVLLNATRESVAARVTLTGPARAAYDAETKEPVPFTTAGDEVGFDLTLEPGDGRAIVLERR